MKESYWGYWFIILGLFVVSILLLTNDATTTSTQDYYQLKEVANSAVYDSVDYGYFQLTGELRIHKEVFVENFLRRFAETITPTDSYKVEFYDLYESPPKVSVKISTQTAGFLVGRDTENSSQESKDDGIYKDNENDMVNDNGTTSLDVVNSIDIIVEFDDSITIPERNNKYKTYCDYYPM